MSSEMGDTKDPKTRQHLGHLFLECMKKHPDAICQIDAATGEEETNTSVLNRSIHLARCMRNCGLRPGDVLSLGGRNHLDLHIPFFAALLNGLPISGVDPLFKYDEIKILFEISRPKIAFCDKEAYDIHADVVRDVGLDTVIVTFGGGENGMEKFIEKHETSETTDEFKPAEFDQDKIYAYLVSTSGSTGKQKLAAIKHGALISKFKGYITMTAFRDNGLNKITLNLSPVNWISGYFNAIGLPLMEHTKLQTSNPDDFDHIIDIINKYKPINTMMSPAMMSSLLIRQEDVDLTCFRMIAITGSKIHQDVVTEFRKLLHKEAILLEVYGMTETIGPCLAPNPMGPPGSCGRRIPTYQVKLVDAETGNEVTEPNTPGELWVKGAGFTEFYNNPEETARTRSDDGFYKTGDLVSRDENDNFFYVDRLKTLIKFRNYHILPVELEDIIRTHPAVDVVCVVGLPHPRDGERPLACVVLRTGCQVDAQEIKDFVAGKVSKNKELSGGVVFLDKLPMTSTDKIARAKLLDMVLQLPVNSKM